MKEEGGREKGEKGPYKGRLSFIVYRGIRFLAALCDRARAGTLRGTSRSGLKDLEHGIGNWEVGREDPAKGPWGVPSMNDKQ